MKKNIAVVGCGYWGKNLVRNFAGLKALHTICDSNAQTLKQIAAQYPGVSTETEFSKVLGNPDIKGVVIATPAAEHYRMAKQSLLAGKDIFVEKPLALHVPEGKELVTLAKEKDRVLLVGHLLEYHPVILKLKEMVDTGELGKVQYIYSNRLNLGKLRTEENVLWSFAPHDISVILLLLGGQMPRAVAAHGGFYLHRDIADVTLTNLSFDHGVKAHIFVSWLHPFKEQRLIVVGDKAMAEFNGAGPDEKLSLYPHHIEWVGQKPVPRTAQAEVVAVLKEEPLILECRDFVECVETRRKPRVDGVKGLQVLEVLAACQQSLENDGKVVTFGDAAKEYFVHETSIVEQPARIGKGTKIWHFCHIMPEVVIGEDCVIGQNVYIGKGVNIGNHVKLENNVSVFESVRLEDDVFCGPSCVFTNVINPRSRISRQHEYKPTLVKKGASIGANATIVCGHTVGRYALVGAGAVVTKDIPDHAIVYGNPATVHDWVCECGVKLVFRGAAAKCAACGKTYRKKGENQVVAGGD
jgi:UDP-2-acetamido-3-amino-2,3-dideoxy-glucuronate N-acetyltransferase